MEAIQNIQNALKPDSIPYYIAIYPNKSTIYSEFIPCKMSILQEDSLSKMDQFKNAMINANKGFMFIDVRDNFYNAKKKQDIYLRHDTHWNDLGAYLGYKKLMESIEEEPFSIEDFTITYEESYKGDLINIIGFCSNKTIKEIIPKLTLKDSAIKISHDNVDDMLKTTNPNAKNNTRLLLFRDSYSSAMIQFIQLNFKEAYFKWSDYDQETVEQVKPDIIINARVERHF